MKIFSNQDELLLNVEVDDSSYRHRVIKGEHNIVLKYSLSEHVELPVGSYCIFQGQRYTLENPEAFKKQHNRRFDYTVTFESYQAKAKIWKFRNPVDGRLKFSLTAKPREHLQMFVDNMNRRDTGWTVGDCIDGVETLINYDHDFCLDALIRQASEFKTEYEIEGKRVSLKKVEYNKSNPLPLSYGYGNGFKSGVGRSNSGDQPPTEILFVQGGSDNIDRSKYGNGELLLPKEQTIRYDGEHFEDEDGFVAANARTYVVDDMGLSIRRADKQPFSLAEDSLDASSIYPKRVGTVTSVLSVSVASNFYDFVDKEIPSNLNYEDCLIEGENMTVIFQSGMLAGREFEVKYYHSAVKDKAARRFEIVPQEIDGMTMPNEQFKPKIGDRYAVFHCMLPDAYICDNQTKTGASWDMFRAAVRHLFDNEEQKYTFSGELDGIWAKKDWENIGGRIRLGGYIQFRDVNFQKEGVLVRITGIKDYINKPHSPSIELSNQTVSDSVSSELKTLKSEEVTVDDNYRASIQFTKRRFRDAKETISLLESALLDNFTNSINPIAVQTMSMLVGDESLQFRFVNNRTNPVTIPDGISYNNETKQLTAPQGIIQHLTLGISSLSASHKTSEYKFWTVSAYSSAFLDNPTKRYYLYIKANRNTQAAEFILSETPRKMEAEANFYYFLVGVLNSEYDGERSYVSLYGFSEILPGRITTERIVSADGGSWFDLVNNAFKLGDLLKFNVNKDGKLRLKGTFVQSQSGDESAIGCYRGVYNNATTYYQGDEVTYTIGGVTSTYRYVNASSSAGHAPNDTIYWQVIAKGSKGENGTNGKDGKSPALVYRGLYESTKTYIGNDYRVDCVKYGNAYYATTPTTGEITAIPPTNDEAWRPFGGSFESIATGLLLAENANIANFLFANQRMESQTKTNGEPNIFLDGLNGLAKLGWLKVFGSDLIGIDDKGEERIRITPNALPTAGEASTTTDLKVVGRASNGVDGSASSTEVSFSFDAVFNDQEESNTLWGSVEYDIAESGTGLDLSDVLSSANLVDNRGEQIPHQFITEVLTADIYIQSETGWIRIADLKLTNGEYYAIIPQKGRIKVTITLSVYVGGSYNEWSGKIDFSAQAIRGRVKKEEIFLAKDGLMAIYNGNHLRFHSQNGFEMRVGNYGLKLTSTAIQKMTDGKTWNNL